MHGVSPMLLPVIRDAEWVLPLVSKAQHGLHRVLSAAPRHR